MTQIVTEENGQQHEFPDEATPQQILQALGKAPQQPPPANFAQRVMQERGGNVRPLSGQVTPEVFPNALGVATGLSKAGELLQSYQRVGVNPSIAALSPGVAGKTAAKVAEAIPLGGSVVGGPLRQAQSQLAAAADQAASAAGGAASRDVAGESIKSGIEAWRDAFSQRAEDLYNQVNSFMHPDTPIQLSKTMGTLNETSGKFASNPQLASELAVPKLDRIREALDTTNGQLTWQEAQALRSEVGRMLGSPSLIADVPRGQLKQLYGSITDDLGSAASTAGPDANAAWTSANSFYKAGRQRLDGQLMKLWKTDSPEAAYNRVFQAAKSGGTENIARLRTLADTIGPDGMGDVASMMLREAGRPLPSSAAAQQGMEFSPTTFSTTWSKLTPAAKNVIFGAKGSALRDHVEDIAAISKSQAGIEAAGNPSGTARWLGGAGIGAGMMYDPMTALGTAAGGLAAGRAMVSPTLGRLYGSLPSAAQAGKTALVGTGAYAAEEQNVPGSPVSKSLAAISKMTHAELYDFLRNNPSVLQVPGVRSVIDAKLSGGQ